MAESKQEALCLKCGHPTVYHRPDMGCAAGYTEAISPVLKRVIVCGCRHVGRRVSRVRKLAA